MPPAPAPPTAAGGGGGGAQLNADRGGGHAGKAGTNAGGIDEGAQGPPGNSSSVTVTDLCTGTHVYTIRGYSLLIGRGVGENVSSEKFEAGGQEWVVQFYPDGYNDEQNNSEYVALSLTLASAANDLWALYTFTMVDQTGKGNDRQMGRSVARGPCKFESQHFRRGKPRFIKRSDLQNSGLLVDDTVVVRCEVSVVMTNTAAPVPEPQQVTVPPPTLGDDLYRMLEKQQGCDVQFIVGGSSGLGTERISAHQSVLCARSDVFAAMIRTPMRRGAEQGVVTVDDVAPEAFRSLLHFVYTDRLREDDDTAAMAQHLLVASDLFCLERLKLMCEKRLCGQIDNETAAGTLMLADQHAATTLKRVCLEYVASNLQAVMCTSDFALLAQSKTLHVEVLKAAAQHMEDERQEKERADPTARRVRQRTK